MSVGRKDALAGAIGLRRSVAAPMHKVHWRPARATAAVFLGLILLGTFLLMAPFSTSGPHWTPFLPALFTATSAVSLTGLIVVDTGTYWTPVGQAIILALIQLGGFGIMSLASLSGMLLTGRISLRTRQAAAAEGRPVSQGGIRKTLLFTVLVTLCAEVLVALILTLRLAVHYDIPLGRALWEGIFHAVSAFNNAGFSTHSDNVMSFATDALIILPLAAALIGGGLGYPVLAEVVRWVRERYRLVVRGKQIRAHRMSVTARMTLLATSVLLVAGTVAMAATEWTGVLRDMNLQEKLLNAFFMGASPRTAGFNAIDYAQVHPLTLMLSDVLMFIGGGSAGTAGGIKVTTMCVLFAAMIAEFRGESDVSVGHRTIPTSAIRQSLALAVAGIATIGLGVATLRTLEPQFTADQVTFEVLSAFATVGLSTGITAHLSAPSQIILCVIMYVGRVGPTTFIAALAASEVRRRYSYPEERPFIG